MKIPLVLSLLALLGMGVEAALAQSTYRITELFSNQDGSTQFIRLTETAGLDNQTAFADLAITVTYAGGTKRWIFPHALPDAQTARRDVIVANAPLNRIPGLGDVPGFAESARCCTALAIPDYVLPANFLPTDGGTVSLGGIDTMTYVALPTDGVSALYADRGIAPAEVPRTLCLGPMPSTCPALVRLRPTLVSAVEYYHAARDHYFVTASAPDIDALDSGRLPGWQRTGASIPVGAQRSTIFNFEYAYDGQAVCRFYIPPATGDSHFFSASPAECAAVRERFPALSLETPAAFHAAIPDAITGKCGVMPGFIDGDIPLQPVYRLWNGRADSNHRYTQSAATRADMIARGWIAEGYGPVGVSWCVLAQPAS